MTDVFLTHRETENLARGDKVMVEIDGETYWIQGKRVVDSI